MPDGSLNFGDAENQKKKKRSKRVPRLEISVARTIEDMMRVTAIRAAVYMAEQNYPYEEEFDGNDFCGTHLIGWVDKEPVACLRIRYFGGFAKIERIAVRHHYRKSRIAFKLIRFAFDYCLRKGFTKVLGHVREELIPLYKMFGCRVVEGGRGMDLPDHSYVEMIFEGELPENAITLDSDPYALIRTEGAWETPSLIEQATIREDESEDLGHYAVAAE